MTKNLGIHFAGTGIRCNAVCPGSTETPLFDPENFADSDTAFSASTAQNCCTSNGRAEAVEQANAILFFASDLSSAVTGQSLVVHRGFNL